MDRTRRVRFNGVAGPALPTQQVQLRSILKQAAGVTIERPRARDLRREHVTDFRRRPIVQDGLTITPDPNPTVPPFRRSRTHRHGTRTFRVRMKGATARLAEQTKITEEAATLSREALLAHLSQHFSRIKTDSKADTELLRSMYVNAKLSGLMPSRGT